MKKKINWRSYLPCFNKAMARELLWAFQKQFQKKHPGISLSIQKGGAEDRWWLVGDGVANCEAADLDLFFAGFMAGADAHRKITSPWE